MLRVSVVTPAVGEPITLDEARNYLRVNQTADDALIGDMISTARRYAENYISRVFLTQTLDIGYPDWPGGASAGYFDRRVREAGIGPNWLPGQASGVIEIPRSPLQSVVSVQYVDQAGVTQTLPSTEYQLRKSEPAQITPALNRAWPITHPQSIEPVIIRVVCGYGAASDVPRTIKAGMLLWLAHLYLNRGDVSAEPPQTVADLLSIEDFGRYG